MDANTDGNAYSVRPSALSEERVYRLTDRVLGWDGPSGRGELMLRDIAAIRFYDYFADGRILRCVVTPKRGRSVVLISRSYSSLGTFDDRPQEMITFAQALLMRAGAANPAIQYTQGMPRSLWLFCVLIGILGAALIPLGLLAALLGGIESDPEGAAGGAIAAAILLVGWLGLFLFLVRWLKRNRPRPFDPKADDLLTDWRTATKG